MSNNKKNHDNPRHNIFTLSIVFGSLAVAFVVFLILMINSLVTTTSIIQ